MLGIAWCAFSHCGWRVLAWWRAEGEFGLVGRLVCGSSGRRWHGASNERRPELRHAVQSAGSQRSARVPRAICAHVLLALSVFEVVVSSRHLLGRVGDDGREVDVLHAPAVEGPGALSSRQS